MRCFIDTGEAAAAEATIKSLKEANDRIVNHKSPAPSGKGVFILTRKIVRSQLKDRLKTMPKAKKQKRKLKLSLHQVFGIAIKKVMPPTSTVDEQVAHIKKCRKAAK